MPDTDYHFPCDLFAWLSATATALTWRIKEPVANELLKLRKGLVVRYGQLGIFDLQAALVRFRRLLPAPIAEHVPPAAWGGNQPKAIAEMLEQASRINLTAPERVRLDWQPEDIAREPALYQRLMRTLFDAFIWCLVRERVGTGSAIQDVRYVQVLAAQFLELHEALDAKKDYSSFLNSLEQDSDELGRRARELAAQDGGAEKAKRLLKERALNLDLVIYLLRQLTDDNTAQIELWRMYQATLRRESEQPGEFAQDLAAFEKGFAAMDPDELAELKRAASDNPPHDLRWTKVQSDPACRLELVWFHALMDPGLRILPETYLGRAKAAVKNEARAPDAARLAVILHGILVAPQKPEG
ncbi:MAG: hypothetical protein WC641_06610 [Patescibacteria group bacterium]